MQRPKAYAYVRMSTAEQLNGDSLTRQTRMYTKYAAEHDLELVEDLWLRDYGVSSFKSENFLQGNLGLFLEYVKRDIVMDGSYLLVESMDRLSRDEPFIALDLLNKIVTCGITIVTLDDKQVYSTEALSKNPYMIFVAVAGMLRSNQESNVKSMRLASSWTGKRSDARSDERAVMTKLIPAWLTVGDDGEIVADVNRAAIIAEIFEKLRDGYGAYSIAIAFTKRGEPTWGGKAVHWNVSYIKKISKNRAVLGECQPHTVLRTRGSSYKRIPEGEAISGYFPAVVSEQLFYAANDAMRARCKNGAGRKGAGIPNLFSGLLKCGLCGAGMKYQNKGAPPKGGRYLRCSTAHQRGNCGGASLRYEHVERGLLQMIGAIDVERILGGASAQTKLTSSRSELLASTAEREELKLRWTRLSREMQENDDAKVAKMLRSDASLLATKVEICDARISALETEIEKLLVIDPQAHQKSIAKLLASIGEGTEEDEQTVSRRRALTAELRWLLTKILITPSATPIDEAQKFLARENDEFDDEQTVAERLIVPDDMEDEFVGEFTEHASAERMHIAFDVPRVRALRKLGVNTKEDLARFLISRPFYATFVYRNGETVHIDELARELKRKRSPQQTKFLEDIKFKKLQNRASTKKHSK